MNESDATATAAERDFEAAYAGEIDFPSLEGDVAAATTAAAREQHQTQLRKALAEELYGPIPAPPDHISVSRQSIAGDQAERLLIEISVAEGRFTVDAALWLPPDANGPVPLICGLDFVGPIGILSSSGFPIDPHARISPRPAFGARDNRVEETLRGVSAFNWPVGTLMEAGYAVLASCYGSWVPDDANEWKLHGVCPLLGFRQDPPTGAISLWAWAIQRLLDAAATCTEIDMSRVSVAGHSRLGKAALWATAHDSRIAAVLANNSGCGGAAPAAHPRGETLAQMAERFPHWTLPHPAGALPKHSFDQHHLLSLIAPRAVYLASAKADLWSDPMGSYMALREAEKFWKHEQADDSTWPSPREIWQSCGQVRNGQLGFHLRPGGHNILPYDWRRFLEFLDAV